jgi:Receptor family ligand binding region
MTLALLKESKLKAVLCVIGFHCSCQRISGLSVSIGVQLAWDSRIVQSASLGGVLLQAIAAVEADHLIPALHQLTWMWDDASCDAVRAVASAAQLKRDWDVSALIAPPCSSSAAAVSQWAFSQSVPVISWAAPAGVAGSGASSINLGGSYTDMLNAYIQLAKHYSWSSVAVLHSSSASEPGYSLFADSLTAALQAAGISVGVATAFEPVGCSSTAAAAAAEAVLTLAQSGERVVLVLGDCSDYRTLMLAAADAGLLQGSAWVLLEAQHRQCYSSAALCGASDGRDAAAAAAMSGALSVSFLPTAAASPTTSYHAAAAAALQPAFEQYLSPPSGTAAGAHSSDWCTVFHTNDSSSSSSSSGGSSSGNGQCSSAYTAPASAYSAAGVDAYAELFYDAVYYTAMSIGRVLAAAGTDAAAAGAISQSDLTAELRSGSACKSCASGDIVMKPTLPSGAVARQGLTVGVLSLQLPAESKADVEAELRLTSTQTTAQQSPLLLSSTVVATLHAASQTLEHTAAAAGHIWPGGVKSAPAVPPLSHSSSSSSSKSGTLSAVTPVADSPQQQQQQRRLKVSEGAWGVPQIASVVAAAVLAVAMAVLAVLARAAEIRRSRSKVHALRNRNRELERYAQPASGHAQLIEREMAQLAPQEQRLLQSVEIEGSELEVGCVIGVGSYAEVRSGMYR